MFSKKIIKHCLSWKKNIKYKSSKLSFVAFLKEFLQRNIMLEMDFSIPIYLLFYPMKIKVNTYF